ncbi:carbohydrate ABC transporter substrate-binding protein (CUT1 family) [Alicyclobacillus sacchari]|uniref:Carbohydrate ABC transporter substrate-binding protein (CUT1 family) n=1 Tax=Alicyclobacillus sacchari TaxID=392010 RepID=A0A4R8LVL4_9BACL|nr:ABC transporter substrate-binding protein [Alicyclobacillus sacchari]TDY51182.1 carbohydrate ABC transporter substrate-binding protein (CUT1 family) [Alicyclobacillus sacchari]
MKTRTKNWAAIVTIASTSTALLAGCGQTQSANTSNGSASIAPKQNTASTNVVAPTHLVNYSNASGSVVWAESFTTGPVAKQLVSAFEKKYPKIKVTMQVQPSSTDTNRADLTATISGGSATPDVYMGDVIWPAQFAHAQLAAPLSDYLPKSFWNRFSNGLVQGATYNGKVYAAPLFADTAFLYYRKDLLQKYHLPVPTTWEQVKSEAATIVKKGGAKYGFVWQGADYEGLTCDFDEYLADAGGSVLTNGKASLNTPAANKALGFMRSLITSGVTPKTVDTFQEPQSENVFTQGQAVFLRNWSYAWSDSQNPASSKVVGKVGVTALPTFAGHGSSGYSTVGGWDLYLNPHTKNLAAALQFIDWMTSPQAQEILAANSEMPTIKAVANSPSLKKYSPVFALLPKVKFVSRPSQTPQYPSVSKAIYDNVNEALAGSVSVGTALKNANSQINSAQSGSGSGGL